MTAEDLLLELHRRRVTRLELAAKMGYTHPMITYFINGKQKITPEREDRIRRAFEEIAAERRAAEQQRPHQEEALSA